MQTQVRKESGKQTKRYQIDMTNGAMFGKIILFTIPLMLSGMLQLLFNAADVIVVGRFVGESALAAVGSTGALTNLLINVFIGFSVGTNVLVAQAIGSGRLASASSTVHTSVLFSVLCGIFLAVLGVIFARPLLEVMDTPEDVIDQASLYMRVYFVGMPVVMLYNFGYAVMRALGDTRRPMYYLIVAGIVNVILNVIFVTQFHLDVAGVALATIISQAISAGLIVRCLCRLERTTGCRLNLKKLHINKRVLFRMMRIGLPAGLQGAVFSISNVLIQSSVNLFGKTAMAGNAAASNIEGFVYTAMNSLHQTALSFTSQNYGANKMDRVKRVFIICMGTVTVIGIVLGGIAYLAGNTLLGIYSSSAEVISYGMIRLKYICILYFLCGLMDTIVGASRGLGSSLVPAIVSLIGACGLRIVWIYTLFRMDKTLENLYLSYPVTWFVTAAAQFVFFVFIFTKIKKSITKTLG